MKRMKNEKKKRKNEETWLTMKTWRNLASHAKSTTISRVCRCCCYFFRRSHRRFPWFSEECVFFPKENQQPVLGGHRFSERQWQFSVDVKQKHTFYRRKSTNNIAKVSFSNNNYSFRIITIQKQRRAGLTYRWGSVASQFLTVVGELAGEAWCLPEPCTERYWSKLLAGSYVSNAVSTRPPTLSLPMVRAKPRGQAPSRCRAAEQPHDVDSASDWRVGLRRRWRRWRRREGSVQGGAASGAALRPGMGTFLWPRSDKFQQFFFEDVEVLPFNSSTELWTVLLCRDVSPQCKLCRRRWISPSCRSWTRLLTARCCATTGAWGLIEQKSVEVPQLQFSDRWWHARCCDDRCMAVQFLDKAVFMPVACRSCWGPSRRGKNCGVPQLQFSTRWPMSLLSGARRCRRCSSCGCGRPCDRAETVLSRTLKGASDSVHRALWGHSSCATETGARAVSALGLPVMADVAAMKVFFLVFPHFSRSSRSSGVQRQFSEPSMIKSSLPSRAPAQFILSVCWHRHSAWKIGSKTATTTRLRSRAPCRGGGVQCPSGFAPDGEARSRPGAILVNITSFWGTMAVSRRAPSRWACGRGGGDCRRKGPSTTWVRRRQWCLTRQRPAVKKRHGGGAVARS